MYIFNDISLSSSENENKKFETKIVEKIKTAFCSKTFFPQKSCRLLGNAEVLSFMKVCPLAAEVS